MSNKNEGNNTTYKSLIGGIACALAICAVYKTAMFAITQLIIPAALISMIYFIGARPILNAIGGTIKFCMGLVNTNSESLDKDRRIVDRVINTLADNLEKISTAFNKLTRVFNKNEEKGVFSKASDRVSEVGEGVKSVKRQIRQFNRGDDIVDNFGDIAAKAINEVGEAAQEISESGNALSQIQEWLSQALTNVKKHITNNQVRDPEVRIDNGGDRASTIASANSNVGVGPPH